MRTAEFDTEFVLRQAMHAFMQFGYAKTSMQKLKEVTHLHPGSIYAAYGNKKGLFLAATEQYQKDRNQQFTALFNDQQSVLSTLKHYLTVIVDECIEGEVAKVCLLTKSISEVEGNDPQICNVLRGNLNAYEHALAQQIQKALDNNEFASSKSAQQLARFLVMGIYGIRTYALTNQDPKSLQLLADDLFAALVN
ncbi:TetR/AcrR family transcriptional regulator [Pseudoalteromonas apostichopi]|uniref:TetR/AcrR family transcriptional regulator n=1 Tax=Pseudoalteromonas apostichopi TaxID=3035452 RepID=UPI0025728E3B|nr:TetR/AcrR family transcriptional regulator [Pseudoalteromonas sp. FE4]